MKKAILLFLAFALLGLAPLTAARAETFVIMNLVTDEGVGADVGRIVVTETPHGLVFTPKLERLPPGMHGFHVHEKPDCGAKEIDGKPTAAGAAGGHLDPEGAGRHGTPWGDGHLGDLPPLFGQRLPELRDLHPCVERLAADSGLPQPLGVRRGRDDEGDRLELPFGQTRHGRPSIIVHQFAPPSPGP